MNKFEVWESFQEQWDPDDIPESETIEARNPTDAAVLFAERYAQSAGDEVAVIVLDEKGQYYDIELVQRWECDSFKPTTLEDLCSP